MVADMAAFEGKYGLGHGSQRREEKKSFCMYARADGRRSTYGAYLEFVTRHITCCRRESVLSPRPGVHPFESFFACLGKIRASCAAEAPPRKNAWRRLSQRDRRSSPSVAVYRPNTGMRRTKTSAQPSRHAVRAGDSHQRFPWGEMSGWPDALLFFFFFFVFFLLLFLLFSLFYTFFLLGA